MRLTSDPADESEPTFSPDGSRIAFRSERDGGGIYVVSAFGGEPRLVARHGRRPRFSPDGTEIAYWVAVGPWYIGKVFVVPAVGGAPTPIEPAFASALYPVWSPDGKKLLFVGARDPKDIPVDAQDWWVAPMNGGPAVKTGASDDLQAPGDQRRKTVDFVVDRACRLAWRSRVLFRRGRTRARTCGESLSQRKPVRRRVRHRDSLPAHRSRRSRRSFRGAGSRSPVSSRISISGVFRSPADSGRVTGDPQQVTGSAFDAHTSVSADGKKLVFISTRSGNPDVWMKDLVSGKETALTATPAHEEQPEITADGTRVCYMVWESSSNGRIYQIATTGGVAERICDDCGRPWDWSPDGSKLLYLIPEGHRQPGLALGLFDVATRQKTVYLDHPDYSLARARFSPDGRWISFAGNPSRGVDRIVIAPFQSRWRRRKISGSRLQTETTAAGQIAMVSGWQPSVLHL